MTWGAVKGAPNGAFILTLDRIPKSPHNRARDEAKRSSVKLRPLGRVNLLLTSPIGNSGRRHPPLPCFYPHSEWAATRPGASWGPIKPRSITIVTNLGCWVLPSNERSLWTSHDTQSPEQVGGSRCLPKPSRQSLVVAFLTPVCSLIPPRKEIASNRPSFQCASSPSRLRRRCRYHRGHALA